MAPYLNTVSGEGELDAMRGRRRLHKSNDIDERGRVLIEEQQASIFRLRGIVGHLCGGEMGG